MSSSEGLELFRRGADMGRRMRDVDWSSTPLGPPSSWPASLRSALSICLGSSFPIAIYWGPRLVLLYNDAWSPILGGKHPWALGHEAAEVWPEIWDTIGPMFEQVMTTGDATYREDQLLPMNRHGYIEECYFNYTFSPIRGEGQAVDGIFNAVIETTFRVIAERRSRLLRDLDEGLTAVRSAAEACTVAARTLGTGAKDVPFCALYLAEESPASARLAATSGLEPGSAAAPARIGFDDGPEQAWPLGRVRATAQIEVVGDLGERFAAPLPGGAWGEPPRAALVAPLLTGGTPHPAGFLVVGASPRGEADEECRQFVGRAASRIATAIANAMAFEAERRRAEALAEIDRAKTVFFNNVSHEFRTPLALMLGPIEDGLADAREPLGPAQRERQEVARRNGIRLQKLVNALLDFARIEAGRTQAAFAATDFAALTSDLASSFRSAVENAGLRFTVDCESLPQPIYVDEGMWEQVVLNLLSNAFKYTLSGGISVTLRAGADGGAVLQVRDTGIGIPHEELPRVFERFHRVEGAVGRTHEGSGIGLTLVHELVKLHGGTIGVASVPGEGSTFTVTIPGGAAHLPPDHVVAAQPVRPARPGPSAYVEEALRWIPDEREDAAPAASADPGTSRPRVLVADDNADMRDYVRRLLRDKYHVDVAADGVTALAAARRRPPDLIVSDVMMPLLDGFGLLREVRADAALRHIPVIMLSARAGEESRVEGLEAGADDYLVKPFPAGELAAKVAGALELTRLRRQTEHHLRLVNRELDQRVSELETLLDVLPIGIGIALDQECRDIRINPAFAGVLGLPPGANASKTAPPGERPETFRCLDAQGREVAGSDLPMQRAARFGAHVRGAEFDIVHDDGRVVRLLEYAAPLFNEHGEPRGAVGAFIDISERKAIDLEREQLLAREQAARAAAEQASRLKDEFLATLSHELRTPLNAIFGWSHLLRDHRSRPDMLERGLRTIERNARVQRQLIEDLLDMSRIVSGKLRLTIAPVEVAAVVDAAVESILPAAHAKGIRLNVEAGEGIVLGADGDRLQQVVWNLLSNAVKFTPHGGVVDVRARLVDQHVELVVEDSGVGIDPVFIEHVFDRFRQADGTASRRYGGLGLGLSIVKQLVELHGGIVRAESAGPDQGARFVVRLPAAGPLDLDAAAITRGRRTAAVPARRPPDSIAGATVLLVDDDPDARDVVDLVLTQQGARVVAVATAAEALAALERERPDVMLSDIGMPDCDGYELMARVRALPDPRLRAIPAAAFTAFARPQDRRRALQAGFRMHVDKPVDPAELVRVVGELRQ